MRLDPIRQRRVDREGSPFFRYDVPEIAPNAFLIIEYEDIDKATRKYFPLDFIKCANNSAANIRLELSPGQEFLIPSGTIISLSDRAITQLRVWNLSPTVTIAKGEIVLVLQRLPITEDRLLRRRI